MNIINIIDRKIKKANKIILIIGASFLLVETILTVLNVVGRNFLNAPIDSTFELTTLLMVLSFSLCWPYASNVDAHVRVDMLESFLSTFLKKVVAIVLNFLAVVAFAMVAWGLTKIGIQFRQLGLSTDLLEIPLYPFAFIMGLCAFMSTIVFIIKVIYLFLNKER